MSKLRILYVCHNHPDLHPGGTEIFTRDLFRAVKAQGDADAMLLACTNGLHRQRKPGTMFQAIGRSSDELLAWTGHFDSFFQSQTDLYGTVPELSDLLRSFQPDIVHFHHSLLVGVEALFLVKRVRPQARVLFTLHDFYPICVNDGQMVTTDGQRCRAASPDACRRCFPKIPQDRFALREHYLKTLFSQVDRFIAPSAFLKERYVAWGLAPERIEILRNGHGGASGAPHRPLAPGEARDRFGFFGHINRFKGAMVAVEAAGLLARRTDLPFTLRLHGGADFQTEAFRSGFEAAVAAVAQVRRCGRYDRADLPDLMRDIDWVVVPSVWWENAPLVIQEAFAHRRPVICSDIGGMAEAVCDEVDGLHFRAGDAEALMRQMRRAIAEPELWERLVGNIAPPRSITESARDHLALYRRLCDRPAAAPSVRSAAHPAAGPIAGRASRPRRGRMAASSHVAS